MAEKARTTGKAPIRWSGGNDLLRLYLQDIGRVDLLTSEEEVTLSRQVQQRERLLVQERDLSRSRISPALHPFPESADGPGHQQ